MSVYVDNLNWAFERHGRTYKMCHMYADSHDELIAMAERIGLQRKYLQWPGHPIKEHFDVTQTKKKLALKNGAQGTTTRHYAGWANDRRNRTASHLEKKAQLMKRVDDMRAAARRRRAELLRPLELGL